MKSLITCLLFLVLLSGCHTIATNKGLERAANDSEREVIPLAGNFSTEVVGNAVSRALLQRGWRVVSQEPGEIVAELKARDIDAHLTITYESEEVVIESDSYMREGEDRQPYFPIRWIEYLKRSIHQQLALTGQY